MKPNAEELVVSSFETAVADADAEADVNTPLCTLFPTRCTQCLPCD